MADGILPQIGDFLLAFAQGKRGSDIRQQRVTRQLLGGIEQLPQEDVLQSPQFQQLLTVNPERAQAIGAPILQLTEQREQALFDDASATDKMLAEGLEGPARDRLVNRLENINALGGDPSDTQEILDALDSGGTAAARKLMRPTIILGQSQGKIPLPGNNKSLGLSKDKTQLIVQRPDGSIELQPTGIEAPAGTAVSEVKATEILDDGTTIQILKDGTVNVTDTEGNEIPVGPQRTKAIAQAQSFGAQVQGDRALAREQKKAAVLLGKEAFKQLSGVRKSVGTITDIISALDRGAETGLIVSRLPSVRAASIELDNLRNQMGLDVIGGTTFGALSESELNFALDTALPDTLSPPELKDFLIRKRAAQEKVITALQEQARFFSGGGTISDLLDRQAAAGDFRPTPQEQEVAPGVDLTTLTLEQLIQLRQQQGGQQ